MLQGASNQTQLDAFKHRGDPLTQADAHSGQAELHVAAFHIIQQRGRDTGTGTGPMGDPEQSLRRSD